MQDDNSGYLEVVPVLLEIHTYLKDQTDALRAQATKLSKMCFLAQASGESIVSLGDYRAARITSNTVRDKAAYAER
mgnify:CR=1 FL=1